MQTTSAPDRPTGDRFPVKADARKVTFYLPEDLWRAFRARMAAAGESSTSRYLIDMLDLDAASAADVYAAAIDERRSLAA